MSTATKSLSPVEEKLKSWKPTDDIPSWFSAIRGKARDAYFDLALPSRSQEDWHYGEPKRFALTGLDIAHAEPGFSGKRYERICNLSGQPRRVACLSMVSENVHEISSSTPLRDAGVTVMSLRQGLALRGDLIQPYWSKPLIKVNQDRLTASHFALVDNGFFVHIPRNIEAPEPIHLIMETGEPSTVVSPHVLVLADPYSKADVFVHYIGSNAESRNLQLGVIQSHVDDGARLSVTKIEHLGSRTDALTREVAELGKDASYDSVSVHFGGNHIRHEVGTNMYHPGASCNLFGMHYVQEKQRYDFHTHQNHQAENTSSNLLFKGAITGRGRASYNGMITVSEDAQHTNAYQSNRNLLLSPDARADSSPQLVIHANDVRCSHGSTTSNVGNEELFYLQNRGLDPEAARRLLVSGFLAEVADHIPLSTVRDYAYNYVLERLD